MTEPAAAPPRTRLVAGIVVVIAFLAGVIAGAFGYRVWHIRRGPHPMDGRGARFISDRVLWQLDRELDLSDEQHKQVKTILDARTKRIEVLWGNIGPQVRREIDATNREIEGILTPDQRTKFEKMKMRFHRRGPPPGPPPPPFK